MNTHTLSNGHIDLTYKDKTYKIKKLSLLEIFGVYEKQIKEEYMANISDMAKLIPDGQKAEFVRQAIKEMPSGKRLEDAVNEKMDTAQGGIHLVNIILNKCQQVSNDEIVALITDKEATTFIQSAVSFALGQEMPKEKEEESAEKNVETTPTMVGLS